MKYKWIILLFLVFTVEASAEPYIFSIEDEDLVSIPSAARVAILASEADPFWDNCNYVGKPVDLRLNGHADEWVVTTANACGWGNAMGPIWLLDKKSATYRVLLNDVGYSLSLSDHQYKGLPDIKVVGATAGWYEERRWNHTKNKYKKIKDFYVDRSNPAECKLHPEADC